MVRGRRARFFARRGFAIVQEMHISPGPLPPPPPVPTSRRLTVHQEIHGDTVERYIDMENKKVCVHEPAGKRRSVSCRNAFGPPPADGPTRQRAHRGVPSFRVSVRSVRSLNTEFHLEIGGALPGQPST